MLSLLTTEMNIISNHINRHRNLKNWEKLDTYWEKLGNPDSQ